MDKKCIICGKQAEYQIKGTSDFYCRGCAEELFNDLKMLIKVEEEVKSLKKQIDEKMQELLVDYNVGKKDDAQDD
jgi:hypothetical protein